MTATLTDEQQMIRDTARDFAMREVLEIVLPADFKTEELE